MTFFRNPEIKRSLLLHLIVTAAATAAGFLYSPLVISSSAYDFDSSVLGFFVLALCLFFSGWHLLFTSRRYRRLASLSQDIDLLLHGDHSIRFEEYEEGELAILSDELSKMTQRLKEQRDALSQDKRYLADSIADISHQIRTPLTSMNIVLSMLSNPDLDHSKRLSLLQEQNRLCARIDWLIEALLKISRLDAGTVTFKQDLISISDLVKKASAPLEIPMELRGQRLTFSPETGRESFTGDFSWSVEAVSNILKNCMEHTPPDGEVQITASQNTIFTELIIEDNGPGIATEDLPHLFERFYKGRQTGAESIGIGLALSRTILSKQSGTIKAENRDSGGARFIIRIYKELGEM